MGDGRVVLLGRFHSDDLMDNAADDNLVLVSGAVVKSLAATVSRLSPA